MVTLGAAQIACDALIELGVDRAEIMLKQDIFGGDRGVGFEFEHPMTVIMLQRQQRLDRPRYGGVEARLARRLAGPRRIHLLCRHSALHGSARWHSWMGVGAADAGPGFAAGATL